LLFGDEFCEFEEQACVVSLKASAAVVPSGKRYVLARKPGCPHFSVWNVRGIQPANVIVGFNGWPVAT
jgi:recombination DNA repair RAD52 pathway protein